MTENSLKRLFYFTILLLVTLPLFLQACTNHQQEETKEMPDSLPGPVVTNEKFPDYFIFGAYCGECSGECATMFRYNMGGNAHTLQVDHTDSFFKQPRKVNCNTPVNDAAKIRLTGKLVSHIPTEILESTEDKTYGCPDCADGCGVYFEFRMENRVCKFYLDPHDETLNKEIRDFIHYLYQLTNELKK